MGGDLFLRTFEIPVKKRELGDLWGSCTRPPGLSSTRLEVSGASPCTLHPPAHFRDQSGWGRRNSEGSGATLAPGTSPTAPKWGACTCEEAGDAFPAALRPSSAVVTVTLLSLGHQVFPGFCFCLLHEVFLFCWGMSIT